MVHAGLPLGWTQFISSTVGGIHNTGLTWVTLLTPPSPRSLEIPLSVHPVTSLVTALFLWETRKYLGFP